MSKRIPAVAPDNRRNAILVAAKLAFSRYGYARTSMADIAEVARVSRPALYVHFRNKEDLFRSLAEDLTEAALAAAEAAWPATTPFAEGLAQAILAKDLEFFRLIHLSSHGAEIFAQNEALTVDLHAKLATGFARLVANRAKSPEFVGTVVARAVEGLKQGAGSEEEFVASVTTLAELFAFGLAT